MRFSAHSPQAIVKPKPLARSVGNINLSTRTYRYLIQAKSSWPALWNMSRLWDWPSSSHLKHVWIRKMIIDKVHHWLCFLTISLSYSLPPALACLSPETCWRCLSFHLKGTSLSQASLSLRACRFSCLGQELRGQDSHSAQQSGRKYWSSSIWLPLTHYCWLHSWC